MAALSLPELTSMRDALIRARMGGVREVKDQNGETLVYKSDAEMAAALASAERQIAAFSRAAPTTIRFKASKGL